jgi:hypothetical protein
MDKSPLHATIRRTRCLPGACYTQYWTGSGWSEDKADAKVLTTPREKRAEWDLAEPTGAFMDMHYAQA